MFRRHRREIGLLWMGLNGLLRRFCRPAFDEEYFLQVAAEKLVTKYRGTRPVQEWVQVRPRNEALDCLVGNLAVLRLAVRLDERAARAASGEWTGRTAADRAAQVLAQPPARRIRGRA